MTTMTQNALNESPSRKSGATTTSARHVHVVAMGVEVRAQEMRVVPRIVGSLANIDDEWCVVGASASPDRS